VAVLTMPDAKDELNIDQANTNFDAELGVYLGAVTDLIEGFTGPLENRVVAETVRGGRMIALNQIPVVSVTSITDPRGILTHAVADTILNTRSGVIRPKFAVPFADPVDVVYVAGRSYTTVSMPDAINLAARITLANLWDPQRGNAGVSGADDELADERQRTPGYGFALPYRALALLQKWRKASGIA
jgi:hypothetical protein